MYVSQDLVELQAKAFCAQCLAFLSSTCNHGVALYKVNFQTQPATYKNEKLIIYEIKYQYEKCINSEKCI